jgi:hypothetical protein
VCSIEDKGKKRGEKRKKRRKRERRKRERKDLTSIGSSEAYILCCRNL